MRTITLFLVILLVSACARQQSSFDAGMVVSLTGNYSPLLESARNGALLAAEEINMREGREVNLVVRDDNSRGEVTLEMVQGLIEEGIDYLIMATTSGAYLEAADYINSKNVLVLSGTVSSDELKGLDDNLIRLTVNISLYADHLADYAIRQQIKSATIVYDENNRSYADTMATAFTAEISEKIPAIRIQQVGFDSRVKPSYIDIARKIREQASDCVLLIASPFDTAYICQHIDEFDQLLLLSPWGVSRELIENGGRSVEGVVTYLEKGFLGDDPEYSRFVGNYRERFNEEPTYQSMVNYDAVYLLSGAIKSSGPDRPRDVFGFILEEGRFSGVNTDYIFDEYGDCSFELYPYTVRNGSFVRIE